MRINESSEDYLEAILIFQTKNGTARSVDVARHLGVTKPSVSRAMKLLRENGYILMAKDNAITLTDSGREIAESIYNRHKELAAFLMRLGVEETIAFKDACKMEHDLHEDGQLQPVLALGLDELHLDPAGAELFAGGGHGGHQHHLPQRWHRCGERHHGQEDEEHQEHG